MYLNGKVKEAGANETPAAGFGQGMNSSFEGDDNLADCI